MKRKDIEFAIADLYADIANLTITEIIDRAVELGVAWGQAGRKLPPRPPRCKGRPQLRLVKV